MHAVRTTILTRKQAEMIRFPRNQNWFWLLAVIQVEEVGWLV
jgi:hypothetical protein